MDYLWDGNRQLQQHTNTDTHIFTTIYEQNSFEPVARLVWLKDELLKAANDEIKSAERESWEDEPELIPNMQVYHYHNDHLGTPNELTNQQGEVVWLADYEAWGNTAKVVWRKEKLEQLQVSADELQPIRFQGQSFDENTGLHYNRYRYFDPDLGMFISRDPIGLVGGNNVFQYAPNPISWIDPWGLAPFKGQNWGKILEENYGVPKTNPTYHAHHIVFKGQYTRLPKMQVQLFRSKHILGKYGINVNSRANFMWAPNEAHSVKNAERVANALTKADLRVQLMMKCCNMSKTQAKKYMENALQRIGKEIWL